MKNLFTVSVLFFLMSGSAVFADSGAGGTGEPKQIPHYVSYLVKAERYAEANAKLKYFLRQEKKSFAGWSLLAYSQFKSGDTQASLASHKKALALKSNNVDTRFSLGQLYVSLGQEDKAREQLSEIRRYCNECQQSVSLEQLILDSQSS